MIEMTELLPGITLRCFPDDRFKQSCLSIQLVRPLLSEEAAMNALIPAVLLRGCSTAPDLRAVTLRLDDLYGASVGEQVRRIGDLQTTGFYCNFIADRYTLDGEALLAPMVAFVGQLLLEPVTEKGIFRKSYVESEKKNLISTLQTQLNDKRVYAGSRLMETMCQNDPFGVPRLGRVADVKKVTAKKLYTHYRKILTESRIDLFYVGPQPAVQVAAALKPMLDRLDRNYKPLPAQTPFRGGPESHVTETMDVTQGKLAVGYTTPITSRHPDFAAMQVLCTLFGAGMTSKLFVNIREKQSLCYDIGSAYYGSKGILTVSAGIDWDKEQLVRTEIEKQLAACQNAQISQEELTGAKESLCSALLGTHDSPGAIEGYYESGAISGLGISPTEYIDNVQAVSAVDCARAAATLRLHSSFFLKGGV
jgi:predicted Zn-dependent peptidase